MYKIAFNKLTVPIILFVLTILLGVIGEIYSVIPFSLPVWILVASIALFLVASVVLFPNGDIKKFLSITGIMFLVYVVSMVIIFLVDNALGKQVITGQMMIQMSVLALILPVLMSMATSKTLVKLVKVKLPAQEVPAYVSQETIPDEKPQPEAKLDSVQQLSRQMENESVELEAETQQIQADPVVDVEETPVSQLQPVMAKVEEFQQEVFFEDIMDDSAAPKPSEPLVEQPVEQNEPEIFFEDIIDTAEKPDKLMNKPEPVVTSSVATNEPVKEEIIQPEPVNEVILDEVELLPLDGEIENLEVFAETSSETDLSLDKPVEVQEEKHSEPQQEIIQEREKQVIPRLTENPRSKEVDSGGKITSIGKLLVDHRDIENIIETNALMQHVSDDATTTKIISAVAGSKTNDKLATLSDLGGVKYSVVVNEAGFIQASTMKDIHKEQVIGALASGSFNIISNSLKKLGFQPAKELVCQTETASLMISRFADQLITIFIEPEVQLYKMNELEQILSGAVNSDKKTVVNSLGAVNGVIGVLLSSENADVIESKLIDSSKNPGLIAEMIPAFYTNISVFAKNMDQGAVKRIIINTGNEMLLLTHLNTDLLLLYATLNTAIVPENIKNQYEAVLNI